MTAPNPFGIEALKALALLVGLGVDIKKIPSAIDPRANLNRCVFIRLEDGMCVAIVTGLLQARYFLSGYIAGLKYPPKDIPDLFRVNTPDER